NGKQWVTDQPQGQTAEPPALKSYGDFFGIRNYAIARLLNPDQARAFYPDLVGNMETGTLYLAMRHTPSLSAPAPLISQRLCIFISGYTALLPRQEAHLRTMRDNLYTCRFEVKEGKARAYRLEESSTKGPFRNDQPELAGIPNGTYEFYYGK